MAIGSAQWEVVITQIDNPASVYLVARTDTRLASEDDSFNARFRCHNADQADVRFVDTPAAADVVIIFEQFTFKHIDYGQALASDPFYIRYADRMFTINYDDSTGGFLPGCYTSLQQSNFDPLYHRPCAYPKTYNEAVYSDPSADAARPVLLFSFRGSILSHPVRTRLTRIFSSRAGPWIVAPVNKPFHTHSIEDKHEYVTEVLNSHFVLCPRGSSPSTYRLFEVMAMGRCPVILSDAWVAPEGIDWDSCSIRIPENQLRTIPNILQSRCSHALDMGRVAQAVWEQHFSESAKYQSYWRKIRSLMNHYRGDLNANIARWRSRSFLLGNRWMTWQRITDRLRRVTIRRG